MCRQRHDECGLSVFFASENLISFRFSQKTGSPCQRNKSNKTDLQTWLLLLREFDATIIRPFF